MLQYLFARKRRCICKVVFVLPFVKASLNPQKACANVQQYVLPFSVFRILVVKSWPEIFCAHIYLGIFV